MDGIDEDLMTAAKYGLTGRVESDRMSLMRRKDIIKADISDTTIPILRILNSGYTFLLH